MDIWLTRNRNTRHFAFRQNYSIGFTEHRLVRIFISNCFQEFVNNTDILPAMSTDHSPSLISLLNDKSYKNGNSFWKFNTVKPLNNGHLRTFPLLRGVRYWEVI